MTGGDTSDAERLWVGIDLGTQSVKTIVATESGTIRSTGQHPLTSTRDAERHEQNPTEWTDAAAAALAQALRELTDAERALIGGVSYCSTSGTIVALDEHGTPTTPGLMYDDSRGAAFAPALRDAGADRWQKLGVSIQPSWALCRIAWLAAEGLLPPGHRVALQGDVLAAAMLGHAAPTDWTSALKSGYDVRAGEWPTEVLATASIALSQLPDVVAPGTRIGETSAVWERASGLPQGTAVFAGLTDGCAAQLGAGALAPGDWHTVVGTTLVIKGVTPKPVSDGSGAVYSHRAPHGDLWLPGGASNVGAGALTSVFPDADLSALDAVIGERTSAITPSYPLTRRGERFPFLSPDASGFALFPATGSDRYRLRPLDALRSRPLDEAVESIWTGIACVERLCFDVLAEQGAPLTGRFSSSGGGTRSATWNRMRAALLDRPIALPETAEGSLGMAILARWGAAQVSSTPLALDHVASSMSRIRTIVEPDAARATRLADAYAAFRDALTEKGWI
ncbi:FGGY-family carbohydrate kinase [Paramicrobacterium agarici]|uniref:Sugar (Pentulose or hexulose) kinase n=1 Tax=Paramicrobacterium agarici TaxID=630514 RepID=A0A2A9DTB5_9MICO|nr:FGGY family carbohydrate kinase [Microbacterium agarici]PFG29938.1 sugar (pentulose or hexulose) kinase [Microbacterium agarici]